MGQGELFNLLGHRVGDLSRSNNGDGNGGFREMSSGCFGFQNGLGKKGNESVAPGFRRPLELYDIFLLTRIYNEVCPIVRGILFAHAPTYSAKKVREEGFEFLLSLCCAFL